MGKSEKGHVYGALTRQVYSPAQLGPFSGLAEPLDQSSTTGFHVQGFHSTVGARGERMTPVTWSLVAVTVGNWYRGRPTASSQSTVSSWVSSARRSFALTGPRASAISSSASGLE